MSISALGPSAHTATPPAPAPVSTTARAADGDYKAAGAPSGTAATSSNATGVVDRPQEGQLSSGAHLSRPESASALLMVMMRVD